MVEPRAAVTAFLETHRESLVEQAHDLLAVDTQNPPGETASLAGSLETTLSALGLDTERIVADPAKPNLLATLPGESDRTLLYNGHLDTVPFDEETWTHDPLGERDGDRLYGRGATDMKGAVAAMVLAVRAFAETETTPPVTLQFAFVSDEETGGEAGLPTLLANRDLAADGCVIGETTCEQGRHSVTVADRGSIWLTLTATGTAAHGSRPMLGENAIDRLYDAVERIRTEFRTDRLDLDAALDPIVEESVEYYAPRLGESAARELFTYPTVNLGTIEGGESINSVPQSARARVDIRLAPAVDTERILARIRECVDGCTGITIEEVSWSVGTYEPVDSPLVKAVAETAEDVTGERIYRRSATGGGDAKTLRNAGIPTVEFGLGTDTVHAADEYTTVEALAGNAAVYAALPFAFASA
ncbi:ArgE/DapE family deacylase [Salinibaculum salinum]|uniref:M20 family metallopeptidase n=1 Tax=Salinibaculum salinum TaxID=3131996 RepID=UPI0030EF043B